MSRNEAQQTVNTIRDSVLKQEMLWLVQLHQLEEKLNGLYEE